MENKKRKPIISALLSIITPGLGQVYNGEFKKGIIFFFAGYLLIILLAMTELQYHFYGMIAVVLIAICWRLFVIGDAIVVAIRTKEIILNPYNKWYIYLLVAIVTIGISVATDSYIKSEVVGVKAYKMPAGSMAPTLLIGDHFAVNLKSYKTNRPKKGDIIVFKYPKDPTREFIKRVVAVEGDIIESKNKAIFINGHLINESYIQHKDNAIKNMDTRDNFGPYLIPQNKLFTMGDNRDQSFDSRYWGYLDVKDVKGKALFIYWSKNKGRIGKEIK